MVTPYIAPILYGLINNQVILYSFKLKPFLYFRENPLPAATVVNYGTVDNYGTVGK